MLIDSCFLPPHNHINLKVMLARGLGHDHALGWLLRKKIASAQLVQPAKLPANIATINSRVLFCVNSLLIPESRMLVEDGMLAPIGACLPISTLRGLALLGLTEGQSIRIPTPDGAEETVALKQVLYQPEQINNNVDDNLNSRSADYYNYYKPRLVSNDLFTSDSNGYDSGDPGPSAA